MNVPRPFQEKLGGESNVSKVNRKKLGNSSTSFQVSRVNSTLFVSAFFVVFPGEKVGITISKNSKELLKDPKHAQMDDVADI